MIFVFILDNRIFVNLGHVNKRLPTHTACARTARVPAEYLQQKIAFL